MLVHPGSTPWLSHAPMTSERSLHKQKSKISYPDRDRTTRTIGIQMCQDDASTRSADTEHHVCPVPRQITRMLGRPGRRTYRRQEAVSILLVLAPTIQLIVQQPVCQDCSSSRFLENTRCQQVLRAKHLLTSARFTSCGVHAQVSYCNMLCACPLVYIKINGFAPAADPFGVWLS